MRRPTAGLLKTLPLLGPEVKNRTPRPRGAIGSVFSGKRLCFLVRVDLRLGGLVIRVRAVEAHAPCGPGIVDVSAQHIPSLAEMQNTVMALSRPALGCDPDPLGFGHKPQSLTG